MDFAYQYQPAAWGNRARAVPGGSEGNREKSPPAPVEYPPCRCDTRIPPAGVTADSFPRYQSNTITLAANTSWQEVVRFAGRPKKIDVAASAAGVNFRLRNRGEAEADAIRIVNAAFHETQISKELVEAQDPTGAGGQIVTAHGMFTDSVISS
jgi:hypothetical protein